MSMALKDKNWLRRHHHTLAYLGGGGGGACLTLILCSYFNIFPIFYSIPYINIKQYILNYFTLTIQDIVIICFIFMFYINLTFYRYKSIINSFDNIINFIKKIKYAFITIWLYKATQNLDDTYGIYSKDKYYHFEDMFYSFQYISSPGETRIFKVYANKNFILFLNKDYRSDKYSIDSAILCKRNLFMEQNLIETEYPTYIYALYNHYRSQRCLEIKDFKYKNLIIYDILYDLIFNLRIINVIIGIIIGVIISK